LDAIKFLFACGGSQSEAADESERFFVCPTHGKVTQARVVTQKTGQIRFNTCISDYEQTETTLKVTVQLENTRTYHFELPNVVKIETGITEKHQLRLIWAWNVASVLMAIMNWI
jgi:hypothetical protein